MSAFCHVISVERRLQRGAGVSTTSTSSLVFPRTNKCSHAGIHHWNTTQAYAFFSWVHHPIIESKCYWYSHLLLSSAIHLFFKVNQTQFAQNRYTYRNSDRSAGKRLKYGTYNWIQHCSFVNFFAVDRNFSWSVNPWTRKSRFQWTDRIYENIVGNRFSNGTQLIENRIKILIFLNFFVHRHLIHEHDLVKSSAPNKIVDIGGLGVAVNFNYPERKLGWGMGGAE